MDDESIGAVGDGDEAAVRRATRRIALAGLLVALLVAAIFFGSAGYALNALLSGRTEVSRQPSPNGRLVLVVAEWDDVTVEVHRYQFGALRWWRTLAYGRSGLRPRTRWLDDRTVMIGAQRLDIYQGKAFELSVPRLRQEL